VNLLHLQVRSKAAAHSIICKSGLKQLRIVLSKIQRIVAKNRS